MTVKSPKCGQLVKDPGPKSAWSVHDRLDADLEARLNHRAAPVEGASGPDHFTRDTFISAFQLSSAVQLTAPAPGWALPGSLTHCW